MKQKFLYTLITLALAISACAPKVTTDQVVTAFKAAGLEAENVRPMTQKDYGVAPYLCEGVRFYIPSMGENKGGRLFICNSASDRKELSGFYTRLGEKSAGLFSWVFVKGNVVIQINGDLPEEQARKYEAAIP